MRTFEVSASDTAWRRLLAQWGVLTAITIAGLIGTFFSAMGSVSSRPGFGGELNELLMAAYSPGLYRISMIFDALGWLAMGGLLTIAGLAVSRVATVRGPIAAVLGATAITGIIGAFLRLGVVGDLGRQLAASTAAPDGILSTFRTVDLVIGAHFAAGQLTMGFGFLLLGSAVLAIAWQPRIVGWLLVLPGLTSLTLLAGELVLDALLFPVLLLHVVLLAAAGLALAWTWSRSSAPAPISAT